MPIRLPQQTVQDWLKECPESQTFVCIDGRRARSVKELVKVFEKMSKETYKYHVNGSKSDFANWVQGVFHNGHLAANFRSARSLKEAYQYVKRHYAMLERNRRDFRLKQERRERRRTERLNRI
jgi:hypothetical protein